MSTGMLVYGVGTTPFMMLVFAHLVAQHKRYRFAAEVVFATAAVCIIGVVVAISLNNNFLVGVALVGAVGCVYDALGLLSEERHRRSRPSQERSRPPQPSPWEESGK